MSTRRDWVCHACTARFPVPLPGPSCSVCKSPFVEESRFQPQQQIVFEVNFNLFYFKLYLLPVASAICIQRFDSVIFRNSHYQFLGFALAEIREIFEYRKRMMEMLPSRAVSLFVDVVAVVEAEVEIEAVEVVEDGAEEVRDLTLFCSPFLMNN